MENKYQYKNEPFKISDAFKSSPITIIGWYLVLYIIGTFIAMFIVTYFVSINKNMDFKEVFQVAMNSNANIPLYYEIQGYTNFISYSLMFIILLIIGRTYLTIDFKKFYINKSKKEIIINILLIILSVVIFSSISFGANILGELVLNKLGYEGTSKNEEAIQLMIKYSSKALLGLQIILFAPIVEELVYRKSIFELSNNLKPIYRILISALIFTLPHMLSTSNVSIGIWFILFFIYYLAGFLLALIYQLFKENIYASLFAHQANNLVAFLGYIL